MSPEINAELGGVLNDFRRFLGSPEKNVSKSILPIRWFIEVTSRCQLSCEYCPRSISKPAVDMNVKNFNNFKGYLANAKDINLVGLGEPTLYANLVSVLEEIRIVNPWTSIVIVTNAQVSFDDTFIKKLAELRISLVISMDSGNSKIYNSIRRGGDFNKVVINLETINRVKKDNNLKFPYICISSVLFSKTITGAVDTLRFIAPYAQFHHLSNLCEGNESEIDLTKIIHEMVTIGKTLGIQMKGRPVHKDRLEVSGECLDPWAVTYIMADGTVHGCAYPQPETIIGDLKDSNFKTIWENRKTSFSTCQGCTEKNIWYICKGS